MSASGHPGLWPVSDSAIIDGAGCKMRAKSRPEWGRYSHDFDTKRPHHQEIFPMIRQLAPVFFTEDIPATLAYYQCKLGFECPGTWQDPPVYAIVARDEQPIHFRCARAPTPNPDKYDDELLDAYVFVENALLVDAGVEQRDLT
jgi:hypothetical protein